MFLSKILSAMIPICRLSAGHLKSAIYLALRLMLVLYFPFGKAVCNNSIGGISMPPLGEKFGNDRPVDCHVHEVVQNYNIVVTWQRSGSNSGRPCLK